MKAAVLEALDKIAVREVPDPILPDADSVILEVETCSVCGSDIRIFHHGNPRVAPPQILGHEIAGQVVVVGKNITRFKPGDRVAVGADVPCGECRWCREGLGNNCAVNYAIGYQFPGGFAERMLLNAVTVRYGPVHHIPEGLEYDEAALAEPLACCLNGLELAHVGIGDTVVVIGAGPAGCMLMRLARHFGAVRVLAVQRSRGRAQEAIRLGGADRVFCTDDGDPVAAVMDATGGEGADVVITANSSWQTHEQALRMGAHRARINFFGGLPRGQTAGTLDSNLIHYREMMVTGSHGSVPRQHRLALELLAAHVIDGQALVSHGYGLDDIQTAFAMAESHQGMKVMVRPKG
jgi:L-iditol 2-dehydrogenase